MCARRCPCMRCCRPSSLRKFHRCPAGRRLRPAPGAWHLAHAAMVARSPHRAVRAPWRSPAWQTLVWGADLSSDLACLAQPGLEIGGRGFGEFDARDVGISPLSNRCDEAIETVLCVNAAPANCAVMAGALFEHHLHAFDERRALIGLESSSGDVRSLLLLAPLFGLGIGLPGCFGFGFGFGGGNPPLPRSGDAPRRFPPVSGPHRPRCAGVCIGFEQRSVGLSGGCAGRVR
jgi:hypothetical protein